MATQKDAQSLIARLSGDFAKEGKRTCRDCLRSKAMPSRRVQAVLEESSSSSLCLSLDVLTEAQSLVSEILCVSGSTALFQMNKMATAIRFLQLLFSVPHKSPLQDQNKDSATISVDRLDQLIQASLVALVQSVIKLQTAWAPKQSSSGPQESDGDDKDDDDGASRSSVDALTMDASKPQHDARPVLCFVFSSVLRLHSFGKRRQQWMIPLCKALTDLALGSHQSGPAALQLPTSLVEDAIRSMSKLFEEGVVMLASDAAARWQEAPSYDNTSSNNNEASCPPVLGLNHHSFFTKFLSFLMVRITSLLPLLVGPVSSPAESSTTTPLLLSICRILALVRGLPRVMELQLIRNHGRKLVADADGCLRNHVDMAEKVEKQLLKVLWSKKGGEDRIHSRLLSSLLQMKVKAKKANTVMLPVHELMYNGRVWGRSLLLRKLIMRMSGGESPIDAQLSLGDAEMMLKLCEVYLSTALPQCFGILAVSLSTNGEEDTSVVAEGLIADPLKKMATCLVRVEASLSSIDALKRSQLHRLILRWLGSMNVVHPMATQFASSLVYLYLVMGSQDAQGRAVPLLSLMVKLLFDARTSVLLRTRISHVLSRCLTSKAPFALHLQNEVEKEFLQGWKNFSKAGLDRKRKRSKTRAPTTFGVYSPQDTRAVAGVLSLLTRHESELLRDSIKSFVHEDGLSRTSQVDLGAQFKSISLLLGYIHGSLQNRSEDGSMGILSKDEKAILLQQLTHHCVTALAKTRSRKLCQNYIGVISSSLDICSVMSSREGANVPLKTICHLLDVCTDMPHSHAADSLILEATWVLGILAKSIPEACPDDILAAIRKIFIRALSVPDMIAVREALGALVRFGHGIGGAHAQLLPTFLPTDRIPFFQARAKCMVWLPSGSQEVRDDLKHFQSLGIALGCFISSPRRIDKSIFPTPSSYNILPGSYYLQMPTQEGRNAIVIFPPGGQSLEDIRHMCELQEDDELPNVQTLQRVVTSNQNGEGGCKFMLESL